MKLNELLKPSYEPQEIIIQISDKNGAEQDAPGHYGVLTPVIRLGDDSFSGQTIRSFRFNIGAQFLPQLTFTLQSTHSRLKEKNRILLDKATFYIGSNNDKHFIKLDMQITDSGSKESVDSIRYNAELYAPNLYSVHIRAFKNIEEAIKTLCKECQIGLLTNYKFPKLDNIQIIQDGISNIEMMQRIAQYASEKMGTYVICFIDQLMYLNMLEITTLFNDKTIEKIKYSPNTGEKLVGEASKLILNNQISRIDKNNKLERIFKIQTYQQLSNYASSAKTIAKKTEIHNTNIHTFEESNPTIVEHTLELCDSEMIQSNLPEEYQTLYQNKTIRHDFEARLEQFVKLRIRPTYMIPPIYCGMNIPVEIYDENIPVWASSQEEEDYKVIQRKGDSIDTLQPIKNDLLSGDYFVSEIEYSYRCASSTENGSRITQVLTLIAKIPEDELQNQEQQ